MEYTPSIKELSNFPFLKNSKDYIRTRYSSLDSLLAGEHGEKLIHHALNRIRDALSAQRTTDKTEVGNPEELLASYALARVIISCLNNKQLIDRLTRYEAERAYRAMVNEEQWNENFRLEDAGYSRLCVSVATEMGIAVDQDSMSLVDYVELVAPIREDRFRLVNRVVTKGRVKVNNDEVYELLRERIRVLLRRDLPVKVPSSVCEQLAPRLAELQKVYQEQMLRQFGAIEESAFPPCIQALIKAITSGANITHPGRFSLTSFLHNIGMEKTQISGLFARAPDFDPEKTMYQVGHITGSGGTEYTAPACAAMRTTGLCIRPDLLCEKINHPLNYYKVKKKKMVGPGHGEVGE